jgi:hypothetical protein
MIGLDSTYATGEPRELELEEVITEIDNMGFENDEDDEGLESPEGVIYRDTNIHHRRRAQFVGVPGGARPNYTVADDEDRKWRMQGGWPNLDPLGRG